MTVSHPIPTSRTDQQIALHALSAEASERCPDRDALVKATTAFRSYAELTSDMTRTGYFPTLRRDDPQQAELGRLLEAAGHRVYWPSKGA